MVNIFCKNRKLVRWILTLTMLNKDISCSENNVDPDQLASQKPADLDPHCQACK